MVNQNAEGGAEPSEKGDALAQLDLDRNRNNQKLKSRFEHIFRKYEHDFTGIGDEFEIHTDEIVVNNGHLEHMRNEADAGSSASSHFVKTFREKLAHEGESVTSEDDEDDENDSSDDGGGSASDGTDAGDMEHSAHAKPAIRRLGGSENRLDKQRSLELSEVMARHPTPRLPRLFRLLAGEGTSQEPLEVPDDEDSEDESVPECNAPDLMSFISERVPDKAHHSSAQVIARNKRSLANDDTVYALGMSIATQLAKMMGASSEKKSKKKSKKKATVMHGATDPVWDYPELEHTKIRKRKRSASPKPQPHLGSSSRTTSPEGASLWAVHDTKQAGKRRRQDDAAHSVKADIHKSTHAINSTDSKKCWNCCLTRSPSWRKGPHGQDLCLPCGQYYEHHGRMKGFDSATPPLEQARAAADSITNDEPKHEPATGMEVPESLQYENDGDNSNVIQRTHRRSPEQSSRVVANAEEHEPPTPSIPYQANTSRPMMSNASKRRHLVRWTVEEDALLIRLREHDCLRWDDIALHFPRRAAAAVQKNYSNKLRKVQCAGRKLFNARLQDTTGDAEAKTETAINDIQDPDWSAQQDELLAVLRDTDQLHWVEIADLLPGHDAKAVERRYTLLRNSAERRSTPDLLQSKRAGHSNGVASSGLSSLPHPDQSSLPSGVPTIPSLGATTPSSSRKSGNALLRQALGNSHRRRSFLEAAPIRAQADQYVTAGESYPAPDSTLNNIDVNSDPGDPADPRHAWSAAATSQLGVEMQHAKADTIGDNDIVESVGSHQRTRSKGGTRRLTRSNNGRTSIINGSHGKSRHASRSVSAELDPREMLIHSCGNEDQRPEITAMDDKLGLVQPPDLSWEQIVGMAFSSTRSMSMSSQDIFAWIESNYGYYSTAPHGWKNHVRDELRTNDRYTIGTARKRNIVWRIKQDVDDVVDSDPQHETDVSLELINEDNSDTPKPKDNESSVIDSTSSRHTLRSKSRRVTFSPVVIVSTPMRVESRKHRGGREQSLLSDSSFEQAAEVLEIADSDPSETYVATRGSPDIHAEDINTAASASASASNPQAVQRSSDIKREPESSSRLQRPATSEPQAEQALFKKPRTGSARAVAGQSSVSPMAVHRTTPASVYKTPMRPILSRAATRKSLSDLPRNHSTPIINHKLMTPNAAGSTKRIVETPLRELGDPDEDELAG